MRFLVTGGAGFVGNHLVKLLVEKGHEVKVVDNLIKGKKVTFISDDPASPIDFTHFSENEGYEISIKSTSKGIHHFTMYKNET